MNQIDIFGRIAKAIVRNDEWETPDVNYLHECFYLDKKNGTLIWKERPAHHFKKISVMNAVNTRNAFKKVTRESKKGRGSETSCYCVMLDGKNYKVHRIIWKMVYSFDSKKLIDHKDGNRMNNAIENLREATYSQNAKNTAKYREKLSNYSNLQMTFA